jgi:hypothetical protein
MKTEKPLRVLPCLTVFIIALIVSCNSGFAQKALDTEDLLFTEFTVSSDIPSAENLTRDTLKVTVDKKSRKTEYLVRIDPTSFNVADPNSWLVINQIRGRQTLIFLLDLNSLDSSALNHARETISDLLYSLPDSSSQRFMLVTLANQLSFVENFTPDKEAIISALENIRSPRKRLDYKSLIESLANIFTVQYRQDVDQAIEESIRESNIFLAEIRNRAESTVEGLGMFADWFETLSGPKNVLLFSGGYPLKPGPVVQDILRTYNRNSGTGIAPSQRAARIGGGITPGDTAASIGATDEANVNQDIMSASILSAKMGSDNESVSSESLQKLITKLNKNQIILYAFDSRDVRADGLASSSVTGMPSQLVGRHNSSHITAGREFLEYISNPTRGRVIAAESNISSTISASGEVAYLVGFKADKKKDEEGKSKLNLEIKGNSATENLQFRANPFRISHPGSDRALAGIFNFPEYYHDFSPACKYKIEKDEITGIVAVSPRELGFVKDGSDFYCMLEVLGLLTDSEGKPVTGKKKYTFAKQFPLRMNADQYRGLLSRESVTATASAKGINPGDYLLTIVVRQPRTGLLSAAKMDVTFQ